MIDLLSPDEVPHCENLALWASVERDPVPHFTRWIADGLSLAQIAGKCGVFPGEVLRLVKGNKELAEAVAEARKHSAWLWDERAEAVLKQAKDKEQLMKAKELANHYRWRASKLNRETYGDKVDTTVSATLPQLVDHDLARKMIGLVQLAG